MAPKDFERGISNTKKKERARKTVFLIKVNNTWPEQHRRGYLK